MMKIEALKITISPKKDESFQMWSQFCGKTINKNTNFQTLVQSSLKMKSYLVNSEFWALENFCWIHLLTVNKKMTTTFYSFYASSMS